MVAARNITRWHCTILHGAFRSIPFTDRNKEPLYRARYMMAFHPVPFYPETTDADCISLSIIMRDQKRACILDSTWNLSTFGSPYLLREIVVRSTLPVKTFSNFHHQASRNFRSINQRQMERNTYTLRIKWFLI